VGGCVIQAEGGRLSLLPSPLSGFEGL